MLTYHPDIPITESDPGLLTGVVGLFGRNFHFTAVRVAVRNGSQEPCFNDESCREWFDSMQEFYDGVYEACEVPGFDGEWAVFIYPFAD